MIAFKDIPKDLPFWKYASYNGDVPYWEYRLGDADLDRFVVFEGKTWFVTDYVIPCDKNRKFYSAAEVANPAVKPFLALVLIRSLQGSKVLINISLNHDFVHPNPILVAAADIGLHEDMGYNTESFERLVREKHSKYLDATARQLIHDCY